MRLQNTKILPLKKCKKEGAATGVKVTNNVRQLGAKKKPLNSQKFYNKAIVMNSLYVNPFGRLKHANCLYKRKARKIILAHYKRMSKKGRHNFFYTDSSII